MVNYFKDLATEKTFEEILHDVQSYMSRHYADLIGQGMAGQKERVKNYLSKFLNDKELSCKGMDFEDLIEKLYNEMAEYSILTDYLKDKSVEEISINSWKDIKITYSSGKKEALDKTFYSPTHALDVIRRLLYSSGKVLDHAMPALVSHLENDNIRITAYAPPVIDKNIGVAASVRIVNPKNLKRDDFIKFGTVNEEIITFLEAAAVSGVSQCFIGATSSGKTTLMSHILNKVVSEGKRLVTIENETREFDLTKTDEKGKVLSDVLHLVATKEGKNTQEHLLELALTTNPDILCLAEMKSAEAFAVQEAARTGHGVLTTAHANDCLGAYSRMVTLCKMKYDLDFKTLYDLVTEAFPLIISLRQNKKTYERRVVEITEMVIHENFSRELVTLWKYEAGMFIKKNDPSKRLMEKIHLEMPD